MVTTDTTAKQQTFLPQVEVRQQNLQKASQGLLRQQQQQWTTPVYFKPRQVLWLHPVAQLDCVPQFV